MGRSARSFSGDIIWLIGASEGIGRALAKELARQGATLIVSARNEARLKDLLSELGSASHMIVPFDVADIKAMQKAYKTITKVVGVPSCIVHAAGVYSPMHARDLQLDKALQTLDVNLASALKLLSLVLPDLRARRSGHLVFVSSVAGYVGLPNSMAYGASKAGLSNLAESLRIELAPENIKVQLVSPGFVKTRLTKQNDFTMPFLMEVEDAAARIVKGMKSSAFEIHFPRRFSYFMKLLRILPRPIFFWVMKWF